MKKVITAISHSEDCDGAMCAILFGFIENDDVKMKDIHFSTASKKDETIFNVFNEWIQNTSRTEENIFMITDLDVTEDTLLPLLKRINERNTQMSEMNVPDAQKEEYENNVCKIVVVDHHQSSRSLVTSKLYDVGKEFLEIVTPDLYPDFENEDSQAACSTLLEYLVDNAWIKKENITDDLVSMTNAISRYDTWEWMNHPTFNNVFGSNYPIEFYYHTLFGLMGLETFVTQFSNILHNGKSLTPDHFVSSVLADYKEMEEYIEVKAKQVEKSIFGEYNIGIIVVDGYHRYFSITGNSICKRNPDIDFLIALFPANCQFSLRTVRNDLNCARIARFLADEHQGGGHPKAAGGILQENRMFDFLHKYYEERIATAIRKIEAEGATEKIE